MADTTPTTIEPTTHTFDVPGATLTYDVRRNDQSTHTILLMIGYPMGAAGFTTLSGHFTDRTVVTYDPRGIERSTKEASGLPLVEQNVDDLRRLLQELGRDLDEGAVEIFASSGGAVNALALIARHPEHVRTLVAHEPPTLDVLEDRDAAAAAFLAVHETYMSRGFGAGMAHFIALASHEGPFPDDWGDQSAPDPAMFGMPTEDDGSRDDPLLSQDESGIPHHRPDFDAITAAPTRVVIAAGTESEGQLTSRAAKAVANRLGTPAVVCPGGHGGFLGGEYGQIGKPDAFATKLREVLTDPGT